MTDHKQEAIDTIQAELCKAWASGRTTSTGYNSQYNTLDKAEALCDRLAPLMRGEFPRKEVQRVCSAHFLHGYDTPATIGPSGELIASLKALWEGHLEVTGGDRRSGEERRETKSHIVSKLEFPVPGSGINPKVFLSGLDKGGLVEIWKTNQRNQTRRKN